VLIANKGAFLKKQMTAHETVRWRPCVLPLNNQTRCPHWASFGGSIAVAPCGRPTTSDLAALRSYGTGIVLATRGPRKHRWHKRY